ncbi:hypothetical protein PGQ11_010030 [Apiospora arundinis]|uniref:Uncharacterized protein n=1 Tax=Apiospora arundinis TaxID=335852 RepID=A0ABR2I8I9_9PEZI
MAQFHTNEYIGFLQKQEDPMVVDDDNQQ